MTTILPLQTPLSVTAAGVDVKKEKKRKNKEDEAAVVATLEPIGEKKVSSDIYLLLCELIGVEEEEQEGTSFGGRMNGPKSGQFGSWRLTYLLLV